MRSLEDLPTLEEMCQNPDLALKMSEEEQEVWMAAHGEKYLELLQQDKVNL